MGRRRRRARSAISTPNPSRPSTPHAKVGGLDANAAYIYAALRDGAELQFGTFRTSPRGRQPLTFTSFGDQGTPTLGKVFTLPAGVTLKSTTFINDNLGSPAAGDTTLGVERLRPLFRLFNGDLCYANPTQDRVRTWRDFWNNNTRSARNRPWMPSPAWRGYLALVALIVGRWTP